MCYKTQGHCKSSDLSRILNTHFRKSMNLARIKVMSVMICARCKVQQVAYTKLAAAFDNEVASSSNRAQDPGPGLCDGRIVREKIWQYQKESLPSKCRSGRRAPPVGRALLRGEIDLTRA